ncbi:MAG: YbaN family protein [Thermoleophilia bacterium]
MVASTGRSRVVRLAWLAVAYAATGLAVLGVLVPVLPTTPFALLAVFAAARGSKAFHERLLRDPRLGPVVRDWQLHRAVGRRPKQLATGTMAVSAGVLFVAGPSLWVAVGVTCLMASVGAWLWARPEPPRERR